LEVEEAEAKILRDQLRAAEAEITRSRQQLKAQTEDLRASLDAARKELRGEVARRERLQKKADDLTRSDQAAREELEKLRKKVRELSDQLQLKRKSK
jgi:hypothetical protein